MSYSATHIRLNDETVLFIPFHFYFRYALLFQLLLDPDQGSCDSDLDGFKDGLESVDSDLGGFKSDLRGFKDDLGSFDSDLGGFKSDLRGFKGDLGSFDSDLGGFKSDLRGFKGGLGSFDSDLGGFKSDLRGFKGGLGLSDRQECAFPQARSPVQGYCKVVMLAGHAPELKFGLLEEVG